MAKPISAAFNKLVTALMSRLNAADATILRNDFDTNLAMLGTVDLINGKTPVTITAASGASLVKTDTATTWTWTYTGSHVIPPSPASRVVFGGFNVWEGTVVKLTVAGSVVLNETMTMPTGYLEVANLAAGSTQTIKLEIIAPKGNRQPTTTNWFLRSEKLT